VIEFFIATEESNHRSFEGQTFIGDHPHSTQPRDQATTNNNKRKKKTCGKEQKNSERAPTTGGWIEDVDKANIFCVINLLD
jgi:hypothetical protein